MDEELKLRRFRWRDADLYFGVSPPCVVSREHNLQFQAGRNATGVPLDMHEAFRGGVNREHPMRQTLDNRSRTILNFRQHDAPGKNRDRLARLAEHARQPVDNCIQK
ncbi:MAG TPA: hypothetical protein VH370_23285 [Humisphaera sp.]|jgi:hypothetical protein|nr:hypothetical protein [Humisphaera sp.]